MKVYTKNGDAGVTSLVHTRNVPKSDDRIRFVGSADELNSHIGLVKSQTADGQTRAFLEEIQNTLMTIMAGVADPFNQKYKLKEENVSVLEQEIDRLEGLFARRQGFVLPGGNPLSAQIDVARCVARRAERALAAVSVKFGTDAGAKKYMNRLADYLYILARYTDDAAAEEQKTVKISAGAAAPESAAQPQVSEALVQEVLKRMGMPGRITLESAKRLIQKVEEEAARRGKKAVIAVCSPEGNPVAVHVMDGAFLVSFDVAVKKAYTSVAVKMSTMELSALAQPGQTFYGVDKMDGGKIVIFGGGVPLKVGDTIIGGLGVSGGTAEEDHSLAEYALSVLHEVL